MEPLHVDTVTNRMTIEFTVKGHLPPKKDGANSMWRKGAELQRLVALRTAAVAALRERPSFDEAVKVALEVHVGPRNDRSIGDLDNYSTGVLDGLQKAHAATPWQDTPTWTGAPASIRPDQHASLVDDVHVVEIVARKRIGTTDDPWYRIAIDTTTARP